MGPFGGRFGIDFGDDLGVISMTFEGRAAKARIELPLKRELHFYGLWDFPFATKCAKHVSK